MSKEKEYQINYIKYAKAHNKSPEEMLKYDKARYPFYPMVEFILWVNKQKKRERRTVKESLTVALVCC